MVADRKSCAITTAKRLGQFLGDERIKDKGLVCNYVIARRPENLPTSERAIPVAIFSTSPSVQRSFLRKWCGEVGGGRRPPFLAADSFGACLMMFKRSGHRVLVCERLGSAR